MSRRQNAVDLPFLKAELVRVYLIPYIVNYPRHPKVL